MPDDPPAAEGPTAARSARRRQCVVWVAAAVFAALLIVRAYGPRFAPQPTAELPPAGKALDLNRARRGELAQLPGVGRELADAIVERREQLGRFSTVEDLRGVHGIGPKTLDKLRPWLTVADDDSPADAPEEPIQLVRKVPAAPVPAATGVSGKVRPGEPPIDLNTAVETELQRLPGIGPALANRIATARGVARFQTVDDLRKVRGIGAKTLDALRPFVVVSR